MLLSIHIYALSAGPLTAMFINNTPRVNNTTVTINFQLDSGSTDEVTSLRCKFSGPGRTPPLIIENCMYMQQILTVECFAQLPFAGFSGVVVTELPPRKQEYNFTLEGTVRGSGEEEVTLLKRDFRLGIVCIKCTPLQVAVF